MRISNKTVMALVVLLATVMLLQTVVFILVMGTSPVPTGHATGSSAGGTVGFMFIRTGICAVPLTQGWTLISLCANATDTSITEDFSVFTHFCTTIDTGTTKDFGMDDITIT